MAGFESQSPSPPSTLPPLLSILSSLPSSPQSGSTTGVVNSNDSKTEGSDAAAGTPEATVSPPSTDKATPNICGDDHNTGAPVEGIIDKPHGTEADSSTDFNKQDTKHHAEHTTDTVQTHGNPEYAALAMQPHTNAVEMDVTKVPAMCIADAEEGINSSHLNEANGTMYSQNDIGKSIRGDAADGMEDVGAGNEDVGAGNKHASMRKEEGRSKRGAPICAHWLMGKCRKGDECQQLHRSMQSTPNHSGAGGYGSGMRKPAMCSFWKQGKCNKGPDCRFSHTDEGPDNGMPSNPRMGQGKMFGGPPLMGNTGSGLPPGYKTDLCRFRQTRCPFGSACNDAHSIEELRPGKFTQEELRMLTLNSGASSGGGGEKQGQNSREPLPAEGFSKGDRRDCVFWPQGKCKKGDKCPYIHQPVPTAQGGYPGGRAMPPRLPRAPDDPYLRSMSPRFPDDDPHHSPRSRRMHSKSQSGSRSRSRSRSTIQSIPPWAVANRSWKSRKLKIDGGGNAMDHHLPNARFPEQMDAMKTNAGNSRDVMVGGEGVRDPHTPSYREGRDLYRHRKDNAYPGVMAGRRDKVGMEGDIPSGIQRERDAYMRNRKDMPMGRGEPRAPPFDGKAEGEADFTFRGKYLYAGGGNANALPKGEKWRQ